MTQEPAAPAGQLTRERIEEFRREYKIPEQHGDEPWIAEDNRVLNAVCDLALSALSHHSLEKWLSYQPWFDVSKNKLYNEATVRAAWNAALSAAGQTNPAQQENKAGAVSADADFKASDSGAEFLAPDSQSRRLPNNPAVAGPNSSQEKLDNSFDRSLLDVREACAKVCDMAAGDQEHFGDQRTAEVLYNAADMIRSLPLEPQAGWVMVPRIVTDEMRRVAERWARDRPRIYVQELWEALLAATPPQTAKGLPTSVDNGRGGA